MDYYLLSGILFSAHAIITLMTSIEDYIHVFEYNPLLYSSYILIWIVELIFGILLMMKNSLRVVNKNWRNYTCAL